MHIHTYILGSIYAGVALEAAADRPPNYQTPANAGVWAPPQALRAGSNRLFQVPDLCRSPAELSNSSASRSTEPCKLYTYIPYSYIHIRRYVCMYIRQYIRTESYILGSIYALKAAADRPPNYRTPAPPGWLEREFLIDNLLVRIHLIIEMILVDRPCVMGVWIPFSR